MFKLLASILMILVSAHGWCFQARVPNSGSDPVQDTLNNRIAPPAGFKRIAVPERSFAQWLRNLPLKPAGAPVRLFNGSLKPNQRAHIAVLDMDVGTRDLQQCADAIMRLHAEYQFGRGGAENLAFSLTNGQRVSWTQWRDGWRPRLVDNRILWTKQNAIDASYPAFRQWLRFVFIYAGTHSLTRDMIRVASPVTARAGDVFLQGGFPGHAVMVVDVVEDSHGRRMCLLAQSYMPAQDIHILRGPAGSDSPWYPTRDHGVLRTPEWMFDYGDLYRFPSGDD